MRAVVILLVLLLFFLQETLGDLTANDTLRRRHENGPVPVAGDCLVSTTDVFTTTLTRCPFNEGAMCFLRVSHEGARMQHCLLKPTLEVVKQLGLPEQCADTQKARRLFYATTNRDLRLAACCRWDHCNEHAARFGVVDGNNYISLFFIVPLLVQGFLIFYSFSLKATERANRKRARLAKQGPTETRPVLMRQPSMPAAAPAGNQRTQNFATAKLPTGQIGETQEMDETQQATTQIDPMAVPHLQPQRSTIYGKNAPDAPRAPSEARSLPPLSTKKPGMRISNSTIDGQQPLPLPPEENMEELQQPEERPGSDDEARSRMDTTMQTTMTVDGCTVDL